MKVENSAIKKFKPNNWYNKKKNTIEYGIDMVMIDNREYHTMDGGKPLLFQSEKERNKKLRQLNKELKDERSVATEAK